MKIFTKLFLFLLMIVGPLTAIQAAEATDSPSGNCGCFRGKRGPTGPIGPTGPAGQGSNGPYLSTSYINAVQLHDPLVSGTYPVGFQNGNVISQNITVGTTDSAFNAGQTLDIGFSPQETGFYRVTATVNLEFAQIFPTASYALTLLLGGSPVATTATPIRSSSPVPMTASFVLDTIINISSLAGGANEIIVIFQATPANSLAVVLSGATLVITKVES